MGKFQISVAETKILITLSYYTLLQVNFSAISTYYGKITHQFNNKLYSFFVCAREYDSDCKEPPLQEVYSPAGITVSWVLAMWMPLLQLVYVIDVGEMKNYIKQKRGSHLIPTLPNGQTTNNVVKNTEL